MIGLIVSLKKIASDFFWYKFQISMDLGLVEEIVKNGKIVSNNYLIHEFQIGAGFFVIVTGWIAI